MTLNLCCGQMAMTGRGMGSSLSFCFSAPHPAFLLVVGHLCCTTAAPRPSADCTEATYSRSRLHKLPFCSLTLTAVCSWLPSCPSLLTPAGASEGLVDDLSVSLTLCPPPLSPALVGLHFLSSSYTCIRPCLCNTFPHNIQVFMFP